MTLFKGRGQVSKVHLSTYLHDLDFAGVEVKEESLGLVPEQFTS